MALGQNILKLRKKNGLSQEQLGEKVNVTRQTISNWELNETAPNPDQLKLLSKALNISIDELLDNDIKNVLEEKVSNTEKLAGVILKILKFIGIAFIVLLIIDIIAFIIFSVSHKSFEPSVVNGIEMNCKINNKDYLINVESNGKFNCSNCSKKIKNDLKNNLIDYNDLSKTEDNIKDYFKSNNGNCD